MPVTPFHLGPGLAIKSVTGRRFSLLMFGIAQVAIDIEPGVGMLTRASTLHGWSHTYVGAAVIGTLVLFLGRPICEWILKWWNAELRRNRLDWLAGPDGIGWGAATAGAYIGTFSHVALDSIMHFDMRPYAPLSDANGLLGAISTEALYGVCIASGIIGAAIWFAVQLRRKHLQHLQETPR